VTATALRTVVCGFCAREFAEDRGQSACGVCPLTGGCRWIRCPYCGFENPETPRWVDRLARLLTSPEPGGHHD